jgi:leucyl-tRNA---protein transferase
MAHPVFEYIAEPSRCQYLSDQSASNQYRIIFQISSEEFQEMLTRGWRRFGAAYFRPACTACQACVPIRVPVDTFTPTKSQRRALQKSRHIHFEIGTPRVDQRRLDLYARWHAMREAKRGWPESPITRAEYEMQFCFPHPCAREFRYLDGQNLIAIGYVDQTPEAFSSIYFFFDPDYKHLSLGVASVICEIAAARERGLKHLYLGYRVLGCLSMEYKMQFRPHELLQGRPADNEAPRWVVEQAHETH